MITRKEKNMTSEKDFIHNESGALDPTGYSAIKNIESKYKKNDEEAQRFYKLLYTIFDICELADFNLEGRIFLRDKRTNRLWK